MAPKLIESHREGAEMYNGPEVCKQKTKEVLDQFHLPKGLVPLSNLKEAGHNKDTGFIWLKQDKASKYMFKELGATSYGTEVTGFIGDRELKKLTDVKNKEMMIWMTIAADISVNGTENPAKITFATPMGLSKTYELADVEDDPKEMK